MKIVSLWGPVVLIMGLIFAQSSMSDPGDLPGAISDKAAHFLVYAALGAAFVRALAGGRPDAMTLTRILLAALFSTLYGASDEVHQGFVPERTPDPIDLAADAAGSAVGAAMWSALSKARARMRAA